MSRPSTVAFQPAFWLWPSTSQNGLAAPVTRRRRLVRASSSIFTGGTPLAPVAAVAVAVATAPPGPSASGALPAADASVTPSTSMPVTRPSAERSS